MVKDLMAAKRQTNLKVFVSILDQAYQTGREVTEEFKQTMEIVFDDTSTVELYWQVTKTIIPAFI